jgi:hypothetical protein
MQVERPALFVSSVFIVVVLSSVLFVGQHNGHLFRVRPKGPLRRRRTLSQEGGPFGTSLLFILVIFFYLLFSCASSAGTVGPCSSLSFLLGALVVSHRDEATLWQPHH